MKLQIFQIICMNRLIRSTNLATQSLFKFSQFSKFNNNFLSATNLSFIEGQYQKWQKDKNSVSKSFHAFFQLMEDGAEPENAIQNVPQPGKKLQVFDNSDVLGKQLKTRLLIDRIRSLGHQFATLDPLGLPHKGLVGKLDPQIISYKTLMLTQQDLANEVIRKNLRTKNPSNVIQSYKINELKDYLEKVYCGVVGYEYMHITNKSQRTFLKQAIEEHIDKLQYQEPTDEQRLATFQRLCKDQAFIDFLGKKFSNLKRFGIQGLNSAVSAMGRLFDGAASNGAQYIVLGMAHRGRINALHCVFDKPAGQIFRQFLEKTDTAPTQDNGVGYTSGDVKYHLGYITKKKYGEKEVTLSILSNPSHLEAVNPLVYGQTRAISQNIQNTDRSKVLGVIVHGDAALSGQGIVYETIEMDDLKDYECGGIIHIVLNNQIGFTTNPAQGRSSYYCTEIAKVVEAPVFHVNADQPDVLDRCIKIALDYRFKFKKDIFIDIVGYRKHGHNQQDQPVFTQPKMYEIIKNKPSMFDIYSKKLIEKGIISKEKVEETRNIHLRHYEEQYNKVMADKIDYKDSSLKHLYQIKPLKLWGTKTGVSKNVLKQIFDKITTFPTDFNVHPTIKRIYQQRISNFNKNQPLDWATMQSLAFGSILYEGNEVRLSGQDVQRGTFSHRHALISDQKKDVSKYTFLKSISPKITICNSHLSEYGVTGFEYGYSITNPNALVIWQAQFGDFANGAQIIIDNFLVSGQTKWNQQSGLVFNLPHGMDGQGPEHSSGRIQRFLLLSDDNCDVQQNQDYQTQLREGNIQVVSCSTSSNYFHVLRRQLKRNYRKPLILFNSKKLLKFKPANQTLDKILEGTEFQTVYPDDPNIKTQAIKKVLIVNGQFYYEIKAMRDQLKRYDLAIVRLQQIAPFPHEQLKKVLSVYGPNVEYCWVQEEHQNYGSYNFVRPRLNLLLGKKIGYQGRVSEASTAVGVMKIHKKQQKSLLARIFR